MLGYDLPPLRLNMEATVDSDSCYKDIVDSKSWNELGTQKLSAYDSSKDCNSSSSDSGFESEDVPMDSANNGAIFSMESLSDSYDTVNLLMIACVIL